MQTFSGMQTLPLPLGGVSVVILDGTGECGVSGMDGPRNGCLGVFPFPMGKKMQSPSQEKCQDFRIAFCPKSSCFFTKVFCFNVCCVAVAITFKQIGFY